MSPRLAVLAVMGSAILFSGKGVLIKLAFIHGASVWLFMALRMAYAFPLFLFLWFRAEKKAQAMGLPAFGKREWGIAAVLGLMGYYFAGLLDMSGLQYISAGMERLILYTHPSMVVLFGVLFRGHRVGKPLFAALFLSYAGLWLAFGEEAHATQGHWVWVGCLLVFGSALCYAFFLIMSGETLRKLGSDRLFIAGMLVCTGAVFIQSLFFVDAPEWFANGQIHRYALLVAVLGTVAPTVLLGRGLYAIGAERAAVLGMVGPVFTLFFGHLVLTEPLNWKNAGGLGLTLVGGWILSRERKALTVSQSSPK